jgi:hypothetical protein
MVLGENVAADLSDLRERSVWTWSNKEAVKVFLSLMTQSTFGRKSFWSPVRGTGPEMLLRKFSALSICPEVTPREMMVLRVAVLKFRKLVLEKIERPGKSRFCWS